jgi:hypothetical protein
MEISSIHLGQADVAIRRKTAEHPFGGWAVLEVLRGVYLRRPGGDEDSWLQMSSSVAGQYDPVPTASSGCCSLDPSFRRR